MIGLPLFPASASPDTLRLYATRACRGFADGMVSVLLASWLTELGFDGVASGLIVTATLLGSAALTLGVGLLAHRSRPRSILLAGAALMFLTGLGFAGVTRFWPLLLVAFVGTLNPSAGDVSLFLPVEQAALAETVAERELTATFAWYNLAGSLAGALGALASGLPAHAGAALGWTRVDALRAVFLLYALVALVAGGGYLGLGRSAAPPRGRAVAPLGASRGVVLRLAALFSLDSFAGGFAVQTMLVLWLRRRFGLADELTGAVFFAAGLFSALSQLGSARVAARIGRIRTMVYTHVPANVFLVLAAVMPSAGLAILCLLLRALLSQMDVPARQSYVMAVVSPAERAAAASLTNVPRSLATALSPSLAGWMLDRSTVGWPLVAAGSLKLVYDLLLLWQFARLRPADERA